MNNANETIKITDNIAMSFFKPEIRDKMDAVLEEWRNTAEDKDNVNKFAEWFFNKEGIVFAVVTTEDVPQAAIEDWRETTVGREVLDEVYSFAYWLYRWSNYIHPDIDVYVCPRCKESHVSVSNSAPPKQGDLCVSCHLDVMREQEG